jgi:hypothetical protein
VIEYRGKGGRSRRDVELELAQTRSYAARVSHQRQRDRVSKLLSESSAKHICQPLKRLSYRQGTPTPLQRTDEGNACPLLQKHSSDGDESYTRVELRYSQQRYQQPSSSTSFDPFKTCAGSKMPEMYFKIVDYGKSALVKETQTTSKTF